MPRSLPRPAFVRVTVHGEPRLLPRGTTFDTAVRTFGLWPSPGDLLNVQGQPLHPGIDPGYNTLDGRRESGDPVLRDGQVLGVVNGVDRTERISREVIPVPAGEPGNPQFFLGNAPGEQVVTRGAISGVVVLDGVPAHRARAPAAARRAHVRRRPVAGPRRRSVLDILHRYGVRATFFDVGYLAREHPDLVRQELDAGMVVGNHSWDHPITPPFRDLPHPRITSEIRRTNTELASIGVQPQLFRPPGGSYSPWILRRGRAAGRPRRPVVRRSARLGAGDHRPPHRPVGPVARAAGLDHPAARRRRRPLGDRGGAPAHHPGHPEDGPVVHRSAAGRAVAAARAT